MEKQTIQETKFDCRKIYVRCETKEDMLELSELLGVELTKDIKELYWPEKIIIKKRSIKIKRKVKPRARPEYKYWRGAPLFIQEKKDPYLKMDVYFPTEADVSLFQAKINQQVTDVTKSLWHPKLEMGKFSDFEYTQKPEDTLGLKYSVYVISKGRWDIPYTHKMLKSMGIPHKVVVEECEYERYIRAIGAEYVLKAPFSNLGLGSIPVRNFVWEYSLSKGEEKHWIMDDNILRLWRLHDNERIKLKASNALRFIEDFTDRFSNVAFSGPHHIGFAVPKSALPPFRINSRVYSCILIRNDLPYRWRGKYNEDTDLCLRALKDDWCTLLFMNFLMQKGPTTKMKGGNTDNVYTDNDKRRKFAESLKKQHPDHVEITYKWDRWHHHVNYHVFSEIKLKPLINIDSLKEVDDYGIELTAYIPEKKEKKIKRISGIKKLTFGKPKF